ncbi:MAG: response regulator transcription factor [Bacteroidales bacterium]|nr:response regulator transcription factor [Bacteroidales bacterium]
MISCLIIDDEKKARETFEMIVHRYLPTKLKVVAMAGSVREGVHAINKYKPNIVFLDIEMPGENGFKLFDYFESITFEIVFLTAHKNYAIDAIRFAAFDYLLKPLDSIDLTRLVSRYEKKEQEQNNNARIQALLTNLNIGADINTKIALPTLSGYQMEKISHIIYCEADENYTKIHTVKGGFILVSRTLKIVEEMLPPEYFFRIHKSYLVNLNFIKSYSRTDGHKILLENGVELEIATRRNEEFVKTLTKVRG